MMRKLTWMLLALPLSAVPAAAQAPFNPTSPNPTPGCTATPAQLAEVKRVAIEFYNPAADRVALADPSYKQHNPAFVKGAREAGMNDYDYFKSRFGGPGRQGGGARPGGPNAGAPQPPPGNQTEIVVAECDIAVVIHKQNRQDPTAAPGTFYEAFTFDAFRVKNGKLVEHWDTAVINPPGQGPGGAGAAPGGAPPAGAPGRGGQ
jgi:predicted SnoaL-like aldol condensation-catalyzing enzyme